MRKQRRQTTPLTPADQLSVNWKITNFVDISYRKWTRFTLNLFKFHWGVLSLLGKKTHGERTDAWTTDGRTHAKSLNKDCVQYCPFFVLFLWSVSTLSFLKDRNVKPRKVCRPRNEQNTVRKRGIRSPNYSPHTNPHIYFLFLVWANQLKLSGWAIASGSRGLWFNS
jgi:hypothetical protein